MTAPIFVDDWNTVKERWLAFWNCDMLDRPVLQLSAPKKGAPPVTDAELLREHEIPQRRHGDIDHIYHWGLSQIERTKYIAEGLPVIHSGSSVGQALYYGCEIQYDIHSTWVKPLPAEADTLPIPVLDKSSYWYRWHRDCLRFLAHECDGRYFMLPTFGNLSSDCLALMRGTEQFMFDVIENPEWVRKTDYQVMTGLVDVINDRFVDVARSGMDGYLNDVGMWAPKRPWDIHCDVSAMVSTEAFRELFWPSQKYVIDQSDGYNYYHVDGPGVLRHIDVILEEPGIRAIQWLAGDGGNRCLQDVEVFKKIQAKGKAIQVQATPDEVIPFLRQVRPEGVCFNCWCPDEDTAYKLVEDVTKLYK